MHWSDRLEKVGRALLWLTLALMFVMVPVGVMVQQTTAAADKAAADKAEKKLAEEAKKAPKETGPARLSLKGIGMYLGALDTGDAEGRMWFTNVSAKEGVVCVTGVVTNKTTSAMTRSLASCQAVPAYASALMKVMFAGGELRSLCPKAADCDLDMVDVVDPS